MTDRFDFKIVVGGTFAVGKTTLISAMSESEIVSTEVPTSGSEAAIKENTTVGTEFGTLSSGGDGFEVDLNVYGVPGQQRFSFMWDVVAVGMDGLLLLVDVTKPETWEQTARMADHFSARTAVPTVIGVNRGDDVPDAVEQIQSAIPVAGASYILCNPTIQSSARNAIVEVLVLLLESMAGQEQQADDEGMLI